MKKWSFPGRYVLLSTVALLVVVGVIRSDHSLCSRSQLNGIGNANNMYQRNDTSCLEGQVRQPLPASWRPYRNVTESLQFIIERHELIEGWIFTPSLYVILRLSLLQIQHRIDGSVGEIGVHHGKLTTILATLARRKDVESRHLFAGDLFESMQNLNVDKSGSGNTKSFSQSLQYVGLTMEDFLIYVGPSQKIENDYFAENLPPFRMFSIDGGHTNETTFADLSLVQKHVTDGAVVMLDDMNRGDWFGVTQAALAYHRLSGNYNRLVPLARVGNKLFYTTGSHLQIYRDALRSDPVLNATRQPPANPQRPLPGGEEFFSTFDWYGSIRPTGDTHDAIPSKLHVIQALCELYYLWNEAF